MRESKLPKGKAGRVVPATRELCEALISRVPPGDNEDMIRGWGMTSAEAIRKSYDLSPESLAILADGEIVGIFGCMPGGNLWMMRGEGIEDVAIQFIRQSERYFARWLEAYGHICAFFWKENRRLLRFMKWSGFEMTDLQNGYVRCDRWARRR